MLVIGIGAAVSAGAEWWVSWVGYWHTIGDALITLLTITRWAVIILWYTAVPLLLVASWREGRRVSDPPLWLVAPDQRAAVDAEITPAKVVLAFKNLGISRLTKNINEMGDGAGQMLSPIIIAGCGVEVEVVLPSETSTQNILDQDLLLAENLDRHIHEIQITVASRARTMRIWAANPGALDEPIGASPLIYDTELKADYKRGKAPWGVSLRGDELGVSLYQRHLLITGQSNQGKTKAVRGLALWLALDPTVEFRIADLKGRDGKSGKSDWGMFRSIATTFIAGPADKDIIATTEMLESVAGEMNRRLAEGGTWAPLIAIVDEAQKAYMCLAKDAAGHPYGGKSNTSRYLCAVREIQNQGRTVDVLLWQGTQDPTDQNLPVLAREGAHIRACLAVGTVRKTRMALGDAATDGGAAPHRLRPGLDKGTLVVAGDGAPLARGETSVTVRTYFIDDQAAEEIATRALAYRKPRRPPDEERDLLADVAEALGADEMVRATTCALGCEISRPAASSTGPWTGLRSRSYSSQPAWKSS